MARAWCGPNEHSRSCGVPHPALITADHLELLDNRFGSQTVPTLWIRPRLWITIPTDCDEVRRIMEGVAPVCYVDRLKLTVTVSTKRSAVPFKSNGE